MAHCTVRVHTLPKGAIGLVVNATVAFFVVVALVTDGMVISILNTRVLANTRLRHWCKQGGWWRKTNFWMVIYILTKWCCHSMTAVQLDKQRSVTSQHLEVCLRVKLFRPKASSETRYWILEQVSLEDIDIWQSIVPCTIDWINKRLKTGGHYCGLQTRALVSSTGICGLWTVGCGLQTVDYGLQAMDCRQYI